jgi:hypothetical protein
MCDPSSSGGSRGRASSSRGGACRATHCMASTDCSNCSWASARAWRCSAPAAASSRLPAGRSRDSSTSVDSTCTGERAGAAWAGSAAAHAPGLLCRRCCSAAAALAAAAKNRCRALCRRPGRGPATHRRAQLPHLTPQPVHARLGRRQLLRQLPAGRAGQAAGRQQAGHESRGGLHAECMHSMGKGGWVGVEPGLWLGKCAAGDRLARWQRRPPAPGMLWQLTPSGRPPPQGRAARCPGAR